MIVPAILTDKRDELIRMLNMCKSFTSYAQIDIMDGEFVPSKSVGIEDLKELKPIMRSEAHLMVSEPLQWIDSFKKVGTERIIFHFEIKKNKEEVIDGIRNSGLSVGLAVNPDTTIDDFKYLVDKVDVILFLSVVPGFYGSKFIPRVLEKVKNFKDLYPSKKIGIDGGIKISNIKDAYRIGIDYICVGSALLRDVSPFDAYKRLLEVEGE